MPSTSLAPFPPIRHDRLPDAMKPDSHGALDPGFHGTPVGPAHLGRDTDGVNVT
jgi:hypothetical protein